MAFVDKAFQTDLKVRCSSLYVSELVDIPSCFLPSCQVPTHKGSPHIMWAARGARFAYYDFTLTVLTLNMLILKSAKVTLETSLLPVWLVHGEFCQTAVCAFPHINCIGLVGRSWRCEVCMEKKKKTCCKCNIVMHIWLSQLTRVKLNDHTGPPLCCTGDIGPHAFAHARHNLHLNVLNCISTYVCRDLISFSLLQACGFVLSMRAGFRICIDQSITAFKCCV